MVIQDATVFMYVSFQDDDMISVFGMDSATGALRRMLDVAVSGGPAPMTLSPDRRTLHVGRRGDRALTSFRVEPSNGELTEIGTVQLEGEPVYVAMDRAGRYVLSAYYYQSVVGVHAVDADGGVSGSPIEWRQTAHGAHAILTDRSNRFAYVPHIANRGPNAIFQFRFDAGSGRLTPNDPPRLSPRSIWGHARWCFIRHWMLFISQTSRVVAYRPTTSTWSEGLLHHSSGCPRCQRGMGNRTPARRFR